MKIKEIYNDLYHISFKTQYMLTMTFLRVQEYYESNFPEFRGCYFPLEDYMDRYAQWKGNFTYSQTLSGFNIPGDVYIKWAKLFWQFPDMMRKEIALYNKLLPIIKKKKKFYIIATHNSQAVEHEMAHGLYYLNSKYKKEMDKLLHPRTKFYRDFKKELNQMGYCDKVIKDEIQAYSATEEWNDLLSYKLILTCNDKNKRVVMKIKKIFKKYSKEVKNVL